MALETGTFISDLVATNPDGASPKSSMDEHLRLIKSTIKATFPNVTGAMTMTHTQLNTVTARGLIAGQTWTGTHTFPATTYGVTAAFGASGTGLATLDYVNAVATNAALPGQTGNAGKFLTTDGTNASWAAVPTPLFQTAATAAEIKTGTNNTKVVTASAMLAAQGFTAYFQSADQTITSAGALTIAHSLGRTPIFVQAFLKNVTPELGYSAGDITPAVITAVGNQGAAITFDATNVYIRYGSLAGNLFPITNKTTGASTNITNANWSFFMRALA